MAKKGGRYQVHLSENLEMFLNGGFVMALDYRKGTYVNI